MPLTVTSNGLADDTTDDRRSTEQGSVGSKAKKNSKSSKHGKRNQLQPTVGRALETADEKQVEISLSFLIENLFWLAESPSNNNMEVWVDVYMLSASGMI